jgi:hypothetical protein
MRTVRWPREGFGKGHGKVLRKWTGYGNPRAEKKCKYETSNERKKSKTGLTSLEVGVSSLGKSVGKKGGKGGSFPRDPSSESLDLKERNRLQVESAGHTPYPFIRGGLM